MRLLRFERLDSRGKVSNDRREFQGNFRDDGKNHRRHLNQLLFGCFRASAMQCAVQSLVNLFSVHGRNVSDGHR